MKIVEYDQVDPVKVMYVTQLALDFTLTPDLAGRIRQTDPRPFGCLSICAIEKDVVLGHVGIFRLPMISLGGREDVGGIWAVSTHPQYSGRGVASRLLEEAHDRMRESGLRFSTLGTDRFRVAHELYRRHGYKETNVWATALAPWETAHQPTRLKAQTLGEEGYDLVEKVYNDIAKDYLGFAWRHTPFSRLRLVNLEDIWLLQDNARIVGYAFAHSDPTLLKISNLLLAQGIDAAEAIAALASELKSDYIEAKISRPVEISSLQRAGYHVAHPSWSGFMIKSLSPDVTIKDAHQHFGIGTDRFLISWLDVT